MLDIGKTRIDEIKTLHLEIMGHLKMSLEKAIKIGQLLTEQKTELKHGEFTPWMKDNLPFTERTARNYMKLFQEKHRLKTETVSDLTSAYRLLSEPKPLEGMEKILHCYADVVNQLREETGDWEKAFDLLHKETTFPINVLINWHWLFFGDISGINPKPITDKEFKQIEKAFLDIYHRRMKGEKIVIEYNSDNECPICGAEKDDQSQ